MECLPDLAILFQQVHQAARRLCTTCLPMCQQTLCLYNTLYVNIDIMCLTLTGVVVKKPYEHVQMMHPAIYSSLSQANGYTFRT